jgi:hypothetical protein
MVQGLDLALENSLALSNKIVKSRFLRKIFSPHRRVPLSPRLWLRPRAALWIHRYLHKCKTWGEPGHFHEHSHSRMFQSTPH